MARAHRFWSWYAAAWLLLFAVFFSSFSLQGSDGAWTTALGALCNVLPDALLGVGVVHLCRRLFARQDRRWLGVRLAELGAVFTLAATCSKTALVAFVIRSVAGRADVESYSLGLLLWHALFSLLTFAVLTSVTFGATAASRLRAEEARRAEAELVRARAELKAIRAQLEPHFLFNTLHSVRALIGEDPASAEEALDRLGDLLRYTVRVQGAEEDGVLLREEWEFVRAYVALEKLRLGERLRVVEEASEAALESVVPAFVLQPLVENAIRHGIGARERGGTVWIGAALERGALRLRVRDDGPGANGSASRGLGRGLDLVRARLRALYGEAGSLDLSPGPGAGFSVELRIPGAPEAG
jgi:hypothetical protein